MTDVEERRFWRVDGYRIVDIYREVPTSHRGNIPGGYAKLADAKADVACRISREMIELGKCLARINGMGDDDE